MLTRKQMESTKITANINLKTLAKTNQGSIPLPCTLVPSKHSSGPPHEWDGCPVLHIGNSSGWYLFTLCEHGLLRFTEETLSIWGDYECLNIKEILDEAAKAVGWDISDEVLPPTIETTYTTEIKRETCPHAPAFKWRMIVYEANGNIWSDRWCKTQKKAGEELNLFTTGKETRTFWRHNQKHIEHYVAKA
jgi:hypothetical protein